ncbi:MAG: ATP-binding protein [Nitrospirae bacterium]|nr:ATP-binding protein [Nitrospirota bacterium]
MDRQDRHLTVDDLEMLCIPKRYYMATLDNVTKSKDVKEKLRSYVESVVNGRAAGAGLLIRGETSTGKTYAACSVLKRLRAYVTGFSGLFLDSTMISEDFLRAEFMGEGVRNMERIVDVELLVLDDIGSEKKFEQERIFEIFKQRCNNLKRTIITTNLLKEDDFIKHFGIYGKKFYDMVSGCCLTVEFPDTNLRTSLEADRLEKEIIQG